MARQTLAERVAQLESQLADLQAELRAGQQPAKDWRRTIGAFTDDAGMQEILQGALRLREEDRSKARGKSKSNRKSRS